MDSPCGMKSILSVQASSERTLPAAPTRRCLETVPVTLSLSKWGRLGNSLSDSLCSQVAGLGESHSLIELTHLPTPSAVINDGASDQYTSHSETSLSKGSNQIPSATTWPLASSLRKTMAGTSSLKEKVPSRFHCPPCSRWLTLTTVSP